MIYRKYHDMSAEASLIGFGAWQLGNKWDFGEMSDKEAIYLVDQALELGVNFFDTAPNYALSNSERLLGLAFKNKKRERLVINTKFGHHADGRTDYSSKSLRTSIEGSLKRLRIDYLDSVLLHNPPRELLSEMTCDHYEILERLIEEGKILAYGASLDTAEEMTYFMNHTKGKVIEAFFNLIHQDTRMAFDLALDKGVRIIDKIPLDSGWLSGKYSLNTEFVGIRNRWSKEDISQRYAVVEGLKEFVEPSQSLANIALAFCAAYDAITTIIPGIRTIDQLQSNIKALDYSMDKALRQSLEAYYETHIKDLNLGW